MENFSIINFLANSIPQAIILALFAWTLLGAKETVRFKYVILAGIICAVFFESFRLILYTNLSLYSIIQVLTFIFVIYFLFKVSMSSAVVGVLLTLLIDIVIQTVVVNIGLALTSQNYDDLTMRNGLFAVNYLRVIFGVCEFLLLSCISYILYKKNLKIFIFKNKNKKLNVFSTNKVRHLLLQLVFTFLIVFLNAIFYVKNYKLIIDGSDKIMMVLNFSSIIIFTILIVKSAFKMGENIQKEEKQKRKLDGREMVQNIEYLCNLMEIKNYSEADRILRDMKNDINIAMIYGIENRQESG